MPKLFVKKSITVNQPIEKVNKFLADFNNWRIWSPWLLAEPEAQVTVTEHGSRYAWTGNRVGAGEMELLKNSPNKIEFSLIFLKPWKSKAKTHFELSETNSGTQITWVMNGNLPFFLFWMKKMTETFVGMDYNRGLMMIKDFLENGKINSKVEILGTSTFAATKLIAVSNTTSLDNIGEKMQADFNKLEALGLDSKLALALYPKFDMVNNKIDYKCAIGVQEFPADLSNDFEKIELPELKVVKIKHTGEYKHIGNAWTTAQMMIQHKEFKHQKAYAPFELYINNPKTTSPAELITEVCYPSK